MTRAQLHKNIDRTLDSDKVEPIVKQYLECLIGTMLKKANRKPRKKAKVAA